MAIHEGVWDCPFCERKAVRGPQKFCPTCGNPRGQDIKFYLPDNAVVVTDEAELARARSGPDWNCQFCGGDNTNDDPFCGGCGASKEGAPPRAVVEHREKKEQTLAQPPPTKKSGKSWIGCVLVIALFIGLMVFLNSSKEQHLTVTGFAWERSISTQVYKTVQEEAWEGEMPSRGRKLSERREVHHYDKIQTGTESKTRTVSEQVQTGVERVKVGTRDLGNGYFEDVYEERPVYETRSREESYTEPVYREDPVYRQKITYEIEKWVPGKTQSQSGTDQSPYWPTVSTGPKLKESGRQEKYVVRLKDEEGEFREWITNEADWSRFKQGVSYRATVKRSGTIVSIDGESG